MQFDEFKRKKPSFFGYFIVGVLGAIIGGILILTFAPNSLLKRVQQPVQEVPEKVSQVITEDKSLNNITSAANRVIPSVVSITTIKSQKQILQQKKVQGVGSGFIIDEEGYILTNNHVAGYNTKDISISFYDGRETQGEVVWAEPMLDLSIIKVDMDKLTVASFGDSQNVKIAEPVIAIGNPLGGKFQRTVTAGIISGINRTIAIEDGVFMEDLIQTDASINPGNSGGPLVSSSGDVIGVNTIKFTSAEGIGFAVPINIIKPVIISIKNTGKFVTPKLGIKGFDKEIAVYYDYKVDKGIYIYEVSPGSTAYNAGIRQGDTILSAKGKDINNMMELKEVLYETGVENSIRFRVRDPIGIERYVDVKLEATE